MADRIALPGSTSPANVPWWVTTLVGVLVPVAIVVAQQLDEPWKALLISIAGAVGAALGVSHSGVLTWGPGK